MRSRYITGEMLVDIDFGSYGQFIHMEKEKGRKG